jgi:ABC-type uncharacterized transport system ATPase subunit
LRDVELRDHHGVTRIRRASVAVHAGEILGIAGVEGSGHHELLLALAGRLLPSAGEARVPMDAGLVPEHRQRDGLILGFSVTENVALRGVARARGRMRWPAIARRARRIVEEQAIRVKAVDSLVSTLSGGNQQKLVLGRELEGSPALVVAENPTQGLDIRAAVAIRDRLRAARDAGAGVVVYTSDLDELLSLADRVVVAFGGNIHETPRDADAIGRAMLGALA